MMEIDMLANILIGDGASEEALMALDNLESVIESYYITRAEHEREMRAVAMQHGGFAGTVEALCRDGVSVDMHFWKAGE